MTTTAERGRAGEGDGEEIEDKWKSCRFFLVGNIPAKFRSADLRAVFSQFVEKEYFLCFHYRHRPEQLQPQQSQRDHVTSITKSQAQYETAETSLTTDTATDINSIHSQPVAQPRSQEGVAKTKCCVVAMVKSGRYDGGAETFVQMYGSKNWTTADGGLLRQKVRISELQVDFCGRQNECASSNQGGASPVAVPWEELKLLPELNPPNVMPRGNVGTPLSTFMELIRSCKLPSHVIRKLQLEFPKSRSKKRYGAVGLDYGTEVEPGPDGEVESETVTASRIRKKWKWRDENEANDEEDTIPPDDDHDAEEWERFEAFHNDVDKQGRSNERLYEEELDVVWEKGGSGLVFYTDASYWDQQDGDFDEKCSKEDDWDVDMSAYYDNGGGDKDARDLREMEMERRLREGRDTGTWTGVAGFEKHTKGFGSKVLKKSGWREGSGVGASTQGISEPLEAEGQHPHSKKGLGYRGEKLDRNLPPAAKRKKASRDVIISTVYDRPSEHEDTVLRTAPQTTIKYRDQRVQFLKGEVLRTPFKDQSPDN